MNDDHPRQAYVPPDPSADPAAPDPAHPRRRRASSKAKAVALGALLVGGAGGAAVFGPLAASAASPSASASASPSTGGHPDGPGGPGQGHSEAVTDTSVIATAIGITEAQLLTELNAGKTPAQVATAHGVATQKVIDALVQDGINELAADVKAGRLTQAQADARKADVTQRATDQVNNGFRGDPH
ncbi:MAG: hypothetical protein M3P14_02505 [Chloroflexota bacterium]|nr:hypothetical protein [Chloroflexota bacterium]